MRVAGFVWAGLFIGLGVPMALGMIGSAWSTGPRVGAATLLLTLAAILLLAPLIVVILKRTADPGTGICPVGATCACGHFNFKPRQTCKKCGVATRFTV